MASTVFVDGSTLTAAAWFNDVNTITYTGLTTQILVGGGTGVLGVWTTATGSGAPVMATSPTIATPVINSAAHVGGTWVADATWTLPALTLGGTVSGGGQQLNNVIIGTSTPLAGIFTTATANSFIPNSSTVPTNGMYLPAANTLAWATNSAEKLRLDSSGNLGLGVTPSAWPDGITLEFASGSIGWNSGSTIQLTNNAYGYGSPKYRASAGAAAYQLSPGNHGWLIAASGTAGNAITWTTAMTLDASSNLAIAGTTATKASGTTWANPSDERLKRNVKTYSKGLKELQQLRFVTGEYNGLGGTPNGQKFISVIAQEAQKVIPDAISTFKAKLNPEDADEIDFLSYDASETQILVAVSVQQIGAITTELQYRSDDHESRLAKLEEKLGA